MTAYDRTKVLTHSMLASFDGCAHRVYLENVVGVTPRFEGAEARRGTIVHQALALMIEAGHVFSDAVFVAEQAARGEDLAELGVLWDAVRDRYGDPPKIVPDGAVSVESEKPFFLDTHGDLCAPDLACFAGTIDLIALMNDGSVLVRDYKTGRAGLDRETPVEHTPQLRAYAYAATKLYPDAPSVILELHYIRWRSGMQRVEVPREDFAGAWNEIAIAAAPFFRAKAALESGTPAIEAFPPNPSDLCAWCSARAHCSAWSSVPMIADTAELTLMTAGKLATAWNENKPRMAIAEKMLRAFVAENGPVTMESGAVLDLVPTERAEVSAVRFWDICEAAGFTKYDILDALGATKTGVEDFLRKHAKAAADLKKNLYGKETGAISYAPSTTFSTTKPGKKPAKQLTPEQAGTTT